MNKWNLKNWTYAKEFLFEDICVYMVTLILMVSWDFWVNLVYLIPRMRPDHELTHPYSLGLFQCAVIVFAVIQLIRKLKQMRYFW